jgi:hypothetical protein
VGSGWVSPAPKRDRRLPCLFWEVVAALGSVVVVVVALGGFLRRVWKARGSCGRVLVSSATLEDEAALLSEVAAGFRRRGRGGSDVALWLTPTPLSLSASGS